MSYITSNSKCGNYLPKDETPPKIWLHEKDCGYDSVSMDVFNVATGIVDIPDFKAHDFWDDAKILVLPPFTELTVFDNAKYALDGNWAPKTFKGPGVFDLYGTPQNQDINSAKAKRTRDWSDAMAPCCTGKIQGKWCGAWNPNNPNNVCDARMRVYCSDPQNADKEECSCINSKVKYLPSCFDTKCHLNPLAYKTKDMKDVAQNCPDIMECNQYLSLSDESKLNVINRTKLEQTCVSQKDEQSNITVVNNGDNTTTSEQDGGTGYTGDQSGSYGSTDPNTTYDPTPPPNGSSGDTYGGQTGSPYSNNQPNTPYGNNQQNTPYSNNDNSGKINIGGLQISYPILILIFVIIIGIAYVLLMPSGPQYPPQETNYYPQGPMQPTQFQNVPNQFQPTQFQNVPMQPPTQFQNVQFQ